MRALVFVCCVVAHGLVVTQPVSGQPCSPSSWPGELTLTEGSLENTTICRLSDQDDVELVTYPTSNSPPFIALDNGTLYYSATLDLDGNQTWCQTSDYSIYVKQNGTSPRRIYIKYNYTDDFPVEFKKTNYTSSIQEMTAPGTVVFQMDDSQLLDRDCDGSFIFGSDTFFKIEDGNGDVNAAFRIPSESERRGVIQVNRLLDHEEGDQLFLLNISVREHSGNRKSYTTLEVKILDIDDNDPVFNHSSYVLHVREEDSSMVGQWTHTDPPLAVHDPDVDAVPQDPLVISLSDPGDSAIMDVNSTSGEIRLNRSYDRETTTSVRVVLKVMQTQNPMRSSTVTLTIMIDDVNDNRPLFTRHSYDVSISEHPAANTPIALLSATDADEGANAEFNYTLVTVTSAVGLTTESSGQPMSGALLVVLDPSQLDRETQPQLTVEVGTRELRPEEGGGGCVDGRCTARVVITLLDTNDNSPVFPNASYTATLHDHAPADVIATVTATDLDEGPNAKLTYSLTSYDSGDCADVTIDPISADVNLNHSVTQTKECFMLVTAMDNPLDESQQRSTSVPLRIFLQMGNETIKLDAPVPSRLLSPNRGRLERQLSETLNVNVSVEAIVSDSTGQRSSVYISARKPSTQEQLHRDELQLLVDQNSAAIAAIFESYKEKETTTLQSNVDTEFTPLVIALIALAGVLLLAFLVAVIYIHRSHRSEKRQRRLIQRLSAPTDQIYANADISSLERGDDALICVNNDDDDNDDDDEKSSGVGVTNPIFIDDNGASLESDTDRRNSQFAPTLQQWEGNEIAATSQSERPADSDSGVPSDRENGAGESGSEGSKATTPVIGRDSGPRRFSDQSPYLNAVLDDELLKSSKDGVTDDDRANDDMVDVTCPANYATTPLGHPETSDLRPASLDDQEGSVANVLPPPVEATHVADEAPQDGVEEQENSITFNDNNASGGRTPHFSLVLADLLQKQALARQAAEPDPKSGPESGLKVDPEGTRDQPREDVNADEDEEVALKSGLGLLVRPSTPPPIHSARDEKEGENGGSDDDIIPEEPEPDYAKRVRFSIQVATDEDKEEGGGGEDEGEVGDVVVGHVGDAGLPGSSSSNVNSRSVDNAEVGSRSGVNNEDELTTL